MAERAADSIVAIDATDSTDATVAIHAADSTDAGDVTEIVIDAADPIDFDEGLAKTLAWWRTGG